MSCLLVFKISASNRSYQVHVSHIGMRRVSIEIKTTSRLAVMNLIYNHRHQPADLGISNDSCYGVIFHYGFSYPIQQLLLQRLPVTLLFSFFFLLFAITQISFTIHSFQYTRCCFQASSDLTMDTIISIWSTDLYYRPDYWMDREFLHSICVLSFHDSDKSQALK